MTTHPGENLAQQTITGSFVFKNINRTYRLRIPQNIQTGNPAPLVFNMHGFGSNATQQELYSGMNAVADTAGFYVCYPNGVLAGWNVGWAFGSQADDVGFISALTDTLIANHNIDASAVYACGMSNGGFMSFRLACELNNKIAAIGSVTGSIVPGRLGVCQPGRPVPVMIIHGTDDNTVPYNGSGISLPIEQFISFWLENNECSTIPVFAQMQDINTTDNSTAEKYTYNDCQPNGDLEFIKVIGGAHTWPGSIIANGVTNQDFKASIELWNFFKKYKLPETSSSKESETFNILLSPNPVSDVFRISGLSGPWSGAILNLSGQNLVNFEHWGEQTLSISNLSDGIYLLMVRQGSLTQYFKIIKI
ncbi:MAG: T9SS type A sorting domain-containing protein [Saprospiraceae bacterium]|nr:T9SS type A sorting domain-containing protein [Saprospiraceae bacterium]